MKFLFRTAMQNLPTGFVFETREVPVPSLKDRVSGPVQLFTGSRATSQPTY